ncbi:MAG TPA: hypothetical protein VGO50_10525 [Pyrinomonadaceae bacterium]|nr:hypothetical protein [Pyrinomonadaceae bacterium]
MSRGKEDETGQTGGWNNFSIKHLFAETHRGILLDIIIFLVSVLLIRTLTAYFVELVSNADSGDDTAEAALFLFCLGLLILPPLGAILKRYQFHHRLQLRGKTIRDQKSGLVMGCLFNPIFFFCLTIVVISGVNAFLMQLLFGNKDPGQVIFVSFTIGGLAVAILQTYLVYRFFMPPKHEPKWKFLSDPRAGFLGDLCVFLNMLLFQVLWTGIWRTLGFGRVSGIEDFLGRLFLICFLALLLYFPPRILFLAEDIRRPLTWLTILLANSPMIVRVLLGFGTN